MKEQVYIDELETKLGTMESRARQLHKSLNELAQMLAAAREADYPLPFDERVSAIGEQLRITGAGLVKIAEELPAAPAGDIVGDRDLTRMTNADLIALAADEFGVNLDPKLKKDDMILAIGKLVAQTAASTTS